MNIQELALAQVRMRQQKGKQQHVSGDVMMISLKWLKIREIQGQSRLNALSSRHFFPVWLKPSCKPTVIKLIYQLWYDGGWVLFQRFTTVFYTDLEMFAVDVIATIQLRNGTVFKNFIKWFCVFHYVVIVVIVAITPFIS